MRLLPVNILKKILSYVWLLLAVLIIQGCNRTNSDVEALDRFSLCSETLEQVADSLYSNNSLSRDFYRNYALQADDSADYYLAMIYYAKACFASSEYDSVFYYVNRVLRYSKKDYEYGPKTSLLGEALSTKGNVWLNLSRPDSALMCYEKSARFLEEGGSFKELAGVYSNIADGYIHLGDYAHASAYYRKALTLCDSLKLPNRYRYTAYCGLGQTYMELRDFSLSEYYFKYTYKYISEMNVYERVVLWNYWGLMHYYNKDYEKAYIYSKRAYDIVKDQSQMILERNTCLMNLGELSVLTDRLGEAEIYLQEAYPYFLSIKHKSAIYQINSLRIGLAIKKKQRINLKAFEKMEDSLPGKVDAVLVRTRNVYLQYYNYYQGDYKEAYHYLLKERVYDDSIQKKLFNHRVYELDLRYKNDSLVMRREIEYERKAKEVLMFRISSYFWAIVSALLIIFAIVWFVQDKKKRKLTQELYLRNMSKLRMENIRRYISPHFIFNVLHRNLDNFQGSEKEKTELCEMTKLLRKSLVITEELTVSLFEELEFVQSYLTLERGRMGEDFSVHVEIDEKLDLTTFMVPSMIMQIPVENAIKHGLTGLDQHKILQILIKQHNQGALILITDNGRGFKPGSLSSSYHTGIGLKVLYQTIQLLNTKNKKDKITFDIQTPNGQVRGTEIKIYIPADYNYDL